MRGRKYLTVFLPDGNVKHFREGEDEKDEGWENVRSIHEEKENAVVIVTHKNRQCVFNGMAYILSNEEPYY